MGGPSLGRKLTPAELDAYDVLDPWQLRKVRVLRVRFIPGGFSGITVGNWIAVANDIGQDGTSVLLAHELVHVHQWRDMGAVTFISRYLTQFAKNLVSTRSWHQAYLAISAEKQARYQASEWALRRRGRRNQPG